MTLARKMTYGIMALLVGIVLLAAAALWGLLGLKQNLGEALGRYQELREIYDIGLRVGSARDALVAQPPNRAAAEERLRSAIDRLQLLIGDLPDVPTSPGALAEQRQALVDLLSSLQTITGQLAAGDAADYFDDVTDDFADERLALHAVLSNLAHVADQTRRGIVDVQAAASRQVHAGVAVIACAAAAILVAGILVALALYQAVMGPLHQLGRGVRSIAAGRFTKRLPVTGDAEFVRLAQDFNRMAEELDTLYRELEEKVAIKSKELVRSERLASVGFLAAGVAHEINNPLGIIAGYAELSLRALERAPDLAQQAAVEKTVRALHIICDEAFRCKGITGKLLSLARPGTGQRQAVALATAAEEVAAMVGGLPRFRDRRLTLRFDEQDDLTIYVDPTQLKQVLLNLTVNALEAVEAGAAGEVVLAGRRQEPWVELMVADNGRGMSRETLERVFEPFFTEKRGTVEPGTGLGLSIVHAIVEAHGGKIHAESDGPGRGSRFIVQFPVLREAAKGEVAAAR